VHFRIHYMELKGRIRRPLPCHLALLRNPLHGVERLPGDTGYVSAIDRIHYMELKGSLPTAGAF